MKKIIIVGGGAAGMFAAVSAANEHTEVHIYEHNEKLGKKLFITGKGRCNITNGCDDVEELLSHVVTNARFLYSAFYILHLMSYFHVTCQRFAPLQSQALPDR